MSVNWHGPIVQAENATQRKGCLSLFPQSNAWPFADFVEEDAPRFG